jgi:hypothetical protein
VIGRREFLAFGALPFSGVKPVQPLSGIIIRLTGGPSQIDTWDPKPEALSHIRSPFKAIRTNVSGIQISELFPLMARCAHKYSLVRSVYSDASPMHENASTPVVDFAGACVHARIAVENGARRVEVPMFGSVMANHTWDAHGWGPFSSLASYRDIVAPLFDRAFCGLINDLDARGLLATTRVVAIGEFGRTPHLNPSGGRDHWPHCFTAIVAGGGVEGGRVYGSSDSTGSFPRDNPINAKALLAT